MKWIIMAGALALGGTAVAQDVPGQTAPQTTPATPAPPADPAPLPEPPAPPADTTAMPATPEPPAPATAAAPPPADPASYPLCSRTVQDHCRQRGGR